jgi:hypothetical protein
MNQPIAYRQCPTCGNNVMLGDPARFCHRDGAKLVAKQALCPCGRYLDFRHDKFCDQCGRPAYEAKLTVVEV